MPERTPLVSAPRYIHSAAECAQVPAFAHILTTLERLETHSERTAAAMEKLAENSAIVASHEKRLDGHDKALDVLFKWKNEFSEKQGGRIAALETAHAVDAAEERAEERKDRFWTEVKLKLLTPALVMAFFLLWIVDKLELVQRFHNLWAEFSK